MAKCPMKYYWGYYRGLKTKEVSGPMQYGGDFHSMAQVMNETRLGVALATLETMDYRQEVKEEIALELDMLNSKMEEEGGGEVIAVETPMPVLLPGPYFREWYIKSDLIKMFKGELWNTEYKTTGGYGAATAAYYHNSMQTLSYFSAVKEAYPEVRGTKMFIIVRTKTPRIEVEDILITKDNIRMAKMFRRDAHAEAEEIEATRNFRRKMTHCISLREGECSYRPICFATNPDYQNQWIDEIYIKGNPDEHLGLSGEV